MLPSHIANPDKELLLSQLIPAPGEMADLIRNYDWSNSQLGAISTWPRSLLTVVNFLLPSKFPIDLFWGPDLIQIYNNDYVPILGAKHSRALGRTAREIWSEAWDVLQPMFQQVMVQGIATWSSDQLFFVTRNNYLEESYFTTSFSPIRIEDGSVGGVMAPVFETTQLVLNARRFETLNTLNGKIVNLKDVEQVAKLTISILKENSADVPFALIYLLNSGANKLELSASSCEALNLQQAPLEIVLDKDITTAWPVTEVLIQKELIIVDNLVEKFGDFPGGAWPESPNKAVIMPLFISDTEKPYGILIIGINSRRAFDADYKNFVILLRAQLSSAIAMAKSYQEEHQRAEALLELNRAKTTFFSNISHEFRTPLTLMLGPLEDSLTDNIHPLNVAQKERQLLIYRNTSRLLKLVNSLLDFSRLEENRLQAVYEASDIAKLTINLSSVFRSTIEKAGLEFVVDVGAIEELVYLDQEMFEKIIFNLLSNAFKFTLEGKIALFLRQEKDNIVLTVEDSGVGIPENELPKMFERFHRIEQTQGRSYEGSGIGLALVQELVRLHQGSIQVTSTLGSGTTFTITFPLGKEHLSPEQIGKRETYELGRTGNYFIEEAANWHQEEEVTAEYTQAAIDPSREKTAIVSINTSLATILVVDDNLDMCQYLTRLLRQSWQVEVVHDGQAALEVLEQRLPDLILSDVMMPRLNGIELLEKVRLNPATKLIPFILLSARAGEEARLEGLQLGADDYLVKPFSAKELLTRVNTHLELGSLRRGLEQEITNRTAELKKTYKALEIQTKKQLQAQKELGDHLMTRALEAEERQRKLGEFVDTICHEIRNPLNIIYGGTTLLQEDIRSLINLEKAAENFSDDQYAKILYEKIFLIQYHLTCIAKAAEQQKIVVDDVLDLSKIESGHIEVNPGAFELKEKLENIANMFQSQLDEKKLEFILNIVDKEVVWLKLDGQCLNRILINLISNAIKFTNVGRIILTITTDTSSAQEVILHCSVKDTGIGMSSEEIEQIFNRFSPINRRKSTITEGSGLGLAISKSLIELMHGTIEVKSEKGIGSEFIFTIKCTYASEQEKQEIMASKKKSQLKKFSSIPEIASKKILIVEDNIFNQKIMARYLEKQDCLYEIANDGLEAIEKCAQYRFDLIFMDIEMPNLNGLKATKRIRLQEQTDKFRTPIIGLSGYASEDFKNKALLAGMDSYLVKPCNPEILYAVIKQYVTPTSLTEVTQATTPIISQFRDYKAPDKLIIKEINVSEIIKQFRLKAEALLDANFPFRAVLAHKQFIIELNLGPSKLDTYSALSALNDLKKHLKQSLALMEGIYITLDKKHLQLYITVASKKQIAIIKLFLSDLGFLSPSSTASYAKSGWVCTII